MSVSGLCAVIWVPIYVATVAITLSLVFRRSLVVLFMTVVSSVAGFVLIPLAKELGAAETALLFPMTPLLELAGSGVVGRFSIDAPAWAPWVSIIAWTCIAVLVLSHTWRLDGHLRKPR